MAFYYKPSKYYWISYQDNGRRVREVLRNRDGRKVTDEKVAKYLTNEIDNQLLRGESPVVDSKVFPLDVLNEYKIYCMGIKADRTIVNDCGAIKMFLDRIRPLTFNQINEKSVKEYLDKRILDGEIAHLTANNIKRYINTFLNFCRKQGYLAVNPITGMSKYKVNELPPEYLTKEEIEKLILAAKGEILYPAILTAIYTGMRLGELERLKYKDIDWQIKKVIVQKSKSGRFRAIPFDVLEEVLKDHNNLPFDFTNRRRVFKRIVKRAGLTDIGWHTFRHSFATHLLSNGVDIKTVSYLMGHASIQTTMIYLHISEPHVENSIKKLQFGI